MRTLGSLIENGRNVPSPQNSSIESIAMVVARKEFNVFQKALSSGVIGTNENNKY